MKEYHILSLSGGKDSTALAFYMKENMPEIFDKLELVFCDTEYELPELYDYLNKIEIFLGKKITKIKPPVNFEHILQTRHYLPHPANRWCTVELKTKPFQSFIKNKINKESNSIINIYIGIRADEAHRVNSSTSTLSFTKENFPFVENAINESDVHNILNNSGIGLADFYSWKRRSGCYFCFFQNQMDWLLLNEHYPDLFEKAANMELAHKDIKNAGHFGWNYEIPLKDMLKPDNIIKIKEKYGCNCKNLKVVKDKLINVY